jgi:hypothetical protein
MTMNQIVDHVVTRCKTVWQHVVCNSPSRDRTAFNNHSDDVWPPQWQQEQKSLKSTAQIVFSGRMMVSTWYVPTNNSPPKGPLLDELVTTSRQTCGNKYEEPSPWHVDSAAHTPCQAGPQRLTILAVTGQIANGNICGFIGSLFFTKYRPIYFNRGNRGPKVCSRQDNA